eukprot:515806_1
MEVIILPPAHHELLSSDLPTVEDLKGYDHRIVDGLTDADGYASDDASSSLFPQRKKRQQQQSRASWLLGLAVDPILPGLVRVPSTASLSEDDSTTSSDSDDDDSSLPTSSAKRSRGGVSFNDNVKVQPIPHSSALSFNQRRKMYSTSVEVRLNKTRNKKEYRYDGCDWRNATEEWEMGIDMATGELVHPAHEFK